MLSHHNCMLGFTCALVVPCLILPILHPALQRSLIARD